MAFADEMRELVSEIRTVAWRAARAEYNEWVIVPIPAPPWEEFEEDVNTALDAAIERLWDFMDGDPDLFDVMLDGLAPPADPEIGNVGDVSDQLTVADNINVVWRADIPAAERLMQGWSGAPSDFLARLIERAHGEQLGGGHGAVTRQLAYVAELDLIVRAFQQILLRAREDALEIARRTLQALENLFGSGGGLDFVLTVVGATASVLGLSPWVGAGISVGGHLMSYEDTAAGDEPPDEPRALEGGGVKEILHAAENEITRLHELIDDQEEIIRTALSSDRAQTSGEELNAFLLTGSNVTDDADHYVPPSDLLVGTRNLYVAGYVYFSAAAYHYQAAAWRLHLTFLQEEAAFGRWFWHAKFKFRGFRDRLALDILQPTARYLAESGDALCQAATEYAETDAELADDLDRVLENGTQNEAGDTVLASVDELQELTPTLNDDDIYTPGDFPAERGSRDGSVFAPEKVGF